MFFIDIPIELILLICSLCDKSDLLNLTLTSKDFAQILVPVIFRVVEFSEKNIDFVEPCLSLLSNPDRDVARHVQSFSIQTYYNKEVLQARLPSCLRWMDCLQTYQTTTLDGFTPDAIAALSQISSLQSIDIRFHSFERSSYLEWDMSPLETLQPLYPLLEEFRFRFDKKEAFPEPYQHFIRYLLEAHTQTLRRLAMVAGKRSTVTLVDLISSSTVFPGVTELNIGTPSLQPSLAHNFPNLGHLNIHDHMNDAFPPPLPSDAFPSIRSLRCRWFHPSVVVHALPNLDTVYFHNAEFPHELNLYTLRGEAGYLEWPQLMTEIPVFKGSKIRRMAVCLFRLYLENLPAIAPCMDTMEELAIRTQVIHTSDVQVARDKLIELFRFSPKLKRLSLHANRHYWEEIVRDDATEYLRDIVQQGFEHAPSLEIVQFNGYTFTRENDQWTVQTYPCLEPNDWPFCKCGDPDRKASWEESDGW